MLGPEWTAQCLVQSGRHSAWSRVDGTVLGPEWTAQCLVQSGRHSAWSRVDGTVLGPEWTAQCLVQSGRHNAWSSVDGTVLGPEWTATVLGPKFLWTSMYVQLVLYFTPLVAEVVPQLFFLFFYFFFIFNFFNFLFLLLGVLSPKCACVEFCCINYKRNTTRGL